MHFELHVGVSFCGFPCSVRNSVSPCGFVPSVYSVLREASPRPFTASPHPPLRMERGVNSIVCKQRGCFLDVKEASLRCDGTPPLIELTTRQLVNPSTCPLYLIIILNYELCILNYTRAFLMRVLFTFFKQKGAF